MTAKQKQRQRAMRPDVASFRDFLSTEYGCRTVYRKKTLLVYRPGHPKLADHEMAEICKTADGRFTQIEFDHFTRELRLTHE